MDQKGLESRFLGDSGFGKVGENLVVEESPKLLVVLQGGPLLVLNGVITPISWSYNPTYNW